MACIHPYTYKYIDITFKMRYVGQAVLVYPALGRQRQADLCEFEASLFYKI